MGAIHNKYTLISADSTAYLMFVRNCFGCLCSKPRGCTVPRRMLTTADAAVVPAQASDLLDEEDAVAMAMMAAIDDVDAKITEHLGVAGGAAETAAGAAASAVLRSADESAPTQQESVGEAPLAALLAEAPTDEAVAAPATVETSI